MTNTDFIQKKRTSCALTVFQPHGELVHIHRTKISSFLQLNTTRQFNIFAESAFCSEFPFWLSDYFFFFFSSGKFAFVKPNTELLLRAGLTVTAESLPPCWREIFHMSPLSAHLLLISSHLLWFPSQSQETFTAANWIRHQMRGLVSLRHLAFAKAGD